MQVRMTTLMAGPEGVTKAGDVFEGSAEACQQLLDWGYAQPLEEHDADAPEETATVPEAPETATTRGRRGRPRNPKPPEE